MRTIDLGSAVVEHGLPVSTQEPTCRTTQSVEHTRYDTICIMDQGYASACAASLFNAGMDYSARRRLVLASETSPNSDAQSFFIVPDMLLLSQDRSDKHTCTKPQACLMEGCITSCNRLLPQATASLSNAQHVAAA